MSRVFVSPLATPFHSLVPIFPIPSRYISIFRAPPPRYFSPSLSFLCAGTILKAGRESRVRGLTTAAGLWASTAIGVAVGLGHQGTAVLGTVLALLVLHVLACLNRSPPSSDSH